jgi:hypothetical protein
MTIKDIKGFASFMDSFRKTGGRVNSTTYRNDDIVGISTSGTQTSELIKQITDAVSTGTDATKKTKALAILGNENFQLQTLESNMRIIEKSLTEAKKTYTDNIEKDTCLNGLIGNADYADRLVVWHKFHNDKTLTDLVSADKTIGDLDKTYQDMIGGLQDSYKKSDGTDRNLQTALNVTTDDELKAVKLKKFLELETKELTDYHTVVKPDLDKAIEKLEKDKALVDNRINEARQTIGKAANILKKNKTEMGLQIDETTNKKELHNMIQYDTNCSSTSQASHAEATKGYTVPLWLMMVILLIVIVIAIVVILVIKRSASKQISNIEEKASLALQAQQN